MEKKKKQIKSSHPIKPIKNPRPINSERPRKKIIQMKPKGNPEDRLSDYFETVWDYDSVEDFLKGSYDPEFQKILHILITPYKDRTETDSNNLLSFLSNIKFNETIKSDTLITDLSLSELFEYFKPYISGKLYSFMDTIYNRREKSENLYIKC